MIRSSLFLARRIASSSKLVTPCASTVVSASDAVSLSTTTYNNKSSSSSSSLSLMHQRFFSSDDAATNLGSILQREINEEEEASAEYDGQLPPELLELQSAVSRKWTILEGITGIGSTDETGSGATVRLFRKESGSKGAKIGIVFHCQDTEDDVKFDENDYINEDGLINDAGEEDDEPAQAVRFGVVVSKGGSTVVMQCRAGSEGDVSVESVMVRDGDTESVLNELAGGEGLHHALYQGPEFTELAEDLQESFRTYVVEECGVDEDVTAFISMYADYREQEEYVAWMKTAIDILD